SRSLVVEIGIKERSSQLLALADAVTARPAEIIAAHGGLVAIAVRPVMCIADDIAIFIAAPVGCSENILEIIAAGHVFEFNAPGHSVVAVHQYQTTRTCPVEAGGGPFENFDPRKIISSKLVEIGITT